MKQKDKFKRIAGLLKFPITVLILILVVKQVDSGSINGILRDLSVRVTFLILGLSLIKIVVQYLNWRNFLELSSPSGIREQDKLTSFFAGIAFRMISPGGVGVYGRMFLLPQRKRDSFLAISYEKGVQTWSLLLFGALGGTIYFSSYPLQLKLLAALIIFVLPFIIFLISPIKKRYSDYVERYRKTLLPSLGLQVVVNTLTILQYWIFLNEYMKLSIVEAVSSVPLVQVSNLVPITISGLGVREFFAIKVYSPLGVSSELAVSCSLTIFAFSNLFPALVGVVILVLKHITRLCVNKQGNNKG